MAKSSFISSIMGYIKEQTKIILIRAHAKSKIMLLKLNKIFHFYPRILWIVKDKSL